MAVVHDAASRSHADDVTGSIAVETFSWTHTPVGTPKGVVVTVEHNSSGDQVGQVYYGGVQLIRVVTSVRTVTESSRVYIYFLGTGVPTGARTVSVEHTGTASTQAQCFTVTAGAGMDTVVDAHAGNNDLGIIANPSITVTHTGTLTGWAGFCAHGYGGATPVSTGLQSGEVYRYGFDPGAAVAMVYTRHGGADAASSTYGYTTLVSDDQNLTAIVVKEIAQSLAVPELVMPSRTPV